jgi:hypothetical protein
MKVVDIEGEDYTYKSDYKYRFFGDNGDKDCI